MSQRKHKPWLSFEQQLERLIERGLQVDDKKKAINYLERIGYYRLSGYWYSFRELNEARILPLRKSNFITDSHFEHAVKLYVFDKKLRLLALDALERIELAVRVDIAHLLGEKDTYAHENINLLHGHFSKQKKTKGGNKGKTEHEIWLNKYEQMVRRAGQEPAVKHNIKKYKKLPIWVASGLWDFGMMSKLFSGMKQDDQLVIANKYGAKDGKEFAGWLKSLNFTRNVSAHHGRLWNINVLVRAPLPNEETWKNLNNSRPFFYFCLMKRLLGVICSNSSWSSRFNDLLQEFPIIENKSVSLADFGLIDNWEAWELWTQK